MAGLLLLNDKVRILFHNVKQVYRPNKPFASYLLWLYTPIRYATMSTEVVILEPGLTPNLSILLRQHLPGANVTEVKSGQIRIETPLSQLEQCRFALTGDQCSWITVLSKVVLVFGRFIASSRIEGGNFSLDLQEPDWRQKLVRQLGARDTSPIRKIFMQRGIRAIEELSCMDEAGLMEAVKAPTDHSVLVEALSQEEALAPKRGNDPLAAARLRGIDAKRRLLNYEGAALSSSDAAERLGVTRQAVDKRRKEGKLLAVELDKKGYFYPYWQFGLAGFETILGDLGQKSSDTWEQMSFFVNPSDLLMGRTPLEVLRHGKKDLGDVRLAAQSFMEHGA